MSLPSEAVSSVASASPEPRFERFTPRLGATVHGLDLRVPTTRAQGDALRRALLDHGVLFFRNQQLTPEQFLEFARVFGAPLRHNPYLPSLEEFSGVEVIVSGVGGRLANEAWHADVTWQHNPPKATALYAVELPPHGGDTVWTSATAAYRSLHPLLATYLETLTATNFVDANGYPRSFTQDESEHRLSELRTKYPPIDVPVIKTHPETGEKYIFVNELHTTYIKGLPRTAGEGLLRVLFGALENAEFHARFRWQTGSLAIWDNRLVQHRAIHDYGERRRILHRVTLA